MILLYTSVRYSKSDAKHLSWAIRDRPVASSQPLICHAIVRSKLPFSQQYVVPRICLRWIVVFGAPTLRHNSQQLFASWRNRRNPVYSIVTAERPTARRFFLVLTNVTNSFGFERFSKRLEYRQFWCKRKTSIFFYFSFKVSKETRCPHSLHNADW